MKAILMILSVLLLGCNSQDNWTTATIKKGEHSSSRTSNFRPANKMSFEFVLDESNRTNKTFNQISKLIGVSDGIDHRKHSIRFGYQYNYESGKIGVFSYVRRDAKFEFKKIGEVYVNETFIVTFELNRTHYKFWFKDKYHEYDRTNNLAVIIYALYPYFGGKEPAPHDMIIRYREIK